MNILELDSYRLSDAVKFNDTLNPRLWTDQETLRPEVREQLLKIADDFAQSLGVTDLQLKDVTISGSNAAYTYTPHSDIDLHLVVDLPEADVSDVYRELFDAKKYQYNNMHNITIGGYDVELYVQDANQPHYSQGIYSVLNDKWVQVPRRQKPMVDDISTKSKYETLNQHIEQAVASQDLDRIKAVMDKIKRLRQTGLEQHGEFGPENLAFKMLRTQGQIKKLHDARNAAKDKLLSLDERRKKKKKQSRRNWGYFGGYWYPGTAYAGQDHPAGTEGGGGGDGGGGESIREAAGTSDEQILQDFVEFVVKELKIEHMPKVKLRRDPEWPKRHKTFGRYIDDIHTLEVAWGNRHIMDVLRTVAHELTHKRQHEREDVPAFAGETGSEYENEANARAGILMRDWARLHPEHFDAGQATDLEEGLKQNVAAGVLGATMALGAVNPSQAEFANMTPAQVQQSIKRVELAEKYMEVLIQRAKEDGRPIDTRMMNAIRAKATEMALAQIQKQSGGQQQTQPQSNLPKQGSERMVSPNFDKFEESASGYIPTKKQARDPRFSMALTVDIKPGQVGKEANKLKLKTDRQGHPQIARANGLFENLMQEYKRYKAAEDYSPDEPPGPEFKPTMPAGTLRVDVSDMYDWYKMGQHISRMKGLGRHDFGAGPPSSIVSFGDEDTEHKFIDQIKATGLDVTDIDPADPKRRPGKKIKTDPTYNVNEAEQDFAIASQPIPGDKFKLTINNRPFVLTPGGFGKQHSQVFLDSFYLTDMKSGKTEFVDSWYNWPLAKAIADHLDQNHADALVRIGKADFAWHEKNNDWDSQPPRLQGIRRQTSVGIPAKDFVKSVDAVKRVTGQDRDLNEADEKRRRFLGALARGVGLGAVGVIGAKYGLKNKEHDPDVVFAQRIPDDRDREKFMRLLKQREGYKAQQMVGDTTATTALVINSMAIKKYKKQMAEKYNLQDEIKEQTVAEGIKQDYLWHGSTQKIPALTPRQAHDTGGAVGSNQNAIYATADKNTAIKMGMAERGSDTAMFDQADQLVLFSGRLRHGKNVYLHQLPRYDANGQDMWLPGGNGNEFYTKPDVKEIKPLRIIPAPVDGHLDLVRKPTAKDLKLRQSYLHQARLKHRGITENTITESAVFLNPNTVIVGQEHGKPLNLSPETLKQVKNIADKHGAWYEGNGADRAYTRGVIDQYVGSFDDEVAKTASPNDPKWIYVLFANVDANNRIQRVGVDPKDTIFNRLLATAKDNSFQGIGFTTQALKKFLAMASEGKYDFVKMSQQPATQENLSRFLKAGEALMWPSNWDQYPNRAGKIARAATVDARDQYLASRKSGVYVVGSGHLRALQQLSGKKAVTEDEDLDEVKMSPSALEKFATSPEAKGIRAGFEAELIFRDTQGEADELDPEPDYDADERCYSIQQVIEFFDNDDYGYGLSDRQRNRLEENLDEKYMEWRDEQIISDFRNDAEDLIREKLLEETPMAERIHFYLTDSLQMSDEEADAVIKAGADAPKFTNSTAQKDYADENPEYKAYLEAADEAEQELEESVEFSVNRQDEYWDEALDEYRDNYTGDDDSFFSDVGLRWMSDIANEFNLDWPVWNMDAGRNDGSRDWEDIGSSLQQVVDMPVVVSTNYHSTRRRPGQWIIEPDGSLDPDDKSEEAGLEIVSPPMPLLTAIEKLRAVTDWANDPNGGNAYTNSSTGLHMGVSLPSMASEAADDDIGIDYVKLILFLGDKYVLQQFGREANTYTASALDKLKQNIKGKKSDPAGVIKLLQHGLTELAYKELQKGVGTSKYTSAHIQPGYIEFRSPGGDWLAKSDEEIGVLENTMLRFARAMQIAGDPNAERQEYAKKLYKLVTTDNEQYADQLRLFSEFSAGTINKEQLKKQWAETVLQKELPSVGKEEYEVYRRDNGDSPDATVGTLYARDYDDAYDQFMKQYGQDVNTSAYLDVRIKQPWFDVFNEAGKVVKTLRAKDIDKATDRAQYEFGQQWTDAWNIYRRPDDTPEPKASPRAQVAKRIVTKPKTPTEYNYDIIDQRTLDLKAIDRFYAADDQEASRVFDKWLQMKNLPNDTANYGYRRSAQSRDARKDSADLQRNLGVQDVEPNIAQNFEPRRMNYELVQHDDTNRVIHRMPNATADEVRAWIDQQEREGMPAGFLRTRVVTEAIDPVSGAGAVAPRPVIKKTDTTKKVQPVEPIAKKQAYRSAIGQAISQKDLENMTSQIQVARRLGDDVNENFADGKVKGKSRPGRVKRAGASCKGSVTDLRARAKKYGGEKGRMYHWCANMKGGKK